ncbi:MAG: hypothetical protein ABSC41_13650 [Acidimicrobiales bacterium]
MTVEPGGRSTLGILPLEYLFGSEDPRLVSAFLDAGGVPSTGQTRPPTKGQQIRSGEASRSLLRLRLEQFPPQLVESVCLRGKREGIVRTHRLDAEETTHPVLDGHVARPSRTPQQLTGNLLEVTAVRALWILEHHKALRRLITAEEYATFRRMG